MPLSRRAPGASPRARRTAGRRRCRPRARLGRSPDLRRELARLMRPLVHLPVARDEHRDGDLRPREARRFGRTRRSQVSNERPPAWEQRFRAPVSFLPSGRRPPADAVYVERVRRLAGARARHSRRHAPQVTDHPVGSRRRRAHARRRGGLWFQDETGDESGSWLVQPFHGGETTPFLDGVPHGWSEGLAQAPGIVVAAISDRDGFAVYVSLDGGPAPEMLPLPESVRLGGVDDGGFLRGALSADGSLLCLEHAEHGDLIHPALRVIDPRTGRDRRATSSTRGCRSARGAGRPSRATSGSRSSTSAKATAARDLGPRDRGAHRPRPADSRAPCSSPTGGRTARRSSSKNVTRAGSPLPVRPRDRRARAVPDRARVRLEGARAPRRTRLVPARAGPPPAPRPRRHGRRARQADRGARPPGARTSRGTSRTRTASACTAST